MPVLGSLWPYTSLSRLPQSPILFTKKCKFLTYPLFSAIPPFPLCFLALYIFDDWVQASRFSSLCIICPSSHCWYIHCRKRRDVQGKKASLSILPLHSQKHFALFGAYLKAGHRKIPVHVMGCFSSVCDWLVEHESTVCISFKGPIWCYTVYNHVGHDSAWGYPSLGRDTASVRCFELGMCLTMLNCCKLLM